MNVVFMGSPEFALPTLQLCTQHYKIVGVVTQPDRPVGRGQVLTPPPVKVAALAHNLEVIQPQKLRDPAALQKITEWNPDLIIVAAFGQILRQNLLDLPRFGCINVHASLLPRWRGAAPIQAAILHGDEITGVSIMRMDAGVDTGPILAQRAVEISHEDTTSTLTPRLAKTGADLMIEILPRYLAGELPLLLQEDEKATYAPMIKKEAAELDLNLSAILLARKVRAFDPWPGTYIPWQEGILKILKAYAILGPAKVGEHGIHNGKPSLGTGEGWLVLETLQPAGKKAMPGEAFLRGSRGWLP